MTKQRGRKKSITGEVVKEIAERYHSDMTFKKRMNKDPITTLQKEGISSEDAPSVISALNIDTDVEGYVWVSAEEFDNEVSGSPPTKATLRADEV
jgi:hypothetical protein